MMDNIQNDDIIDYGQYDDAEEDAFPLYAKSVNKQGVSASTEYFINRKGEKVPIKRIRREEAKIKKAEKKAVKRLKKLTNNDSKELKKKAKTEFDTVCKEALLNQGKKALLKTKALIKGQKKFNKSEFDIKTDGYVLRSVKYGIYGVRYEVSEYKGKNPKIDEIAYFLVKSLELFEDVKHNFKNKVHIIINSEYGYNTPAVPVSMINFKYLYCLLKRKEKYKDIVLNQLTFDIIEYTIPGGAGGVGDELKKVLMKPKSVTNIETEALCGTYALLLGMCTNDFERKNYVKKARRAKFDKDAKALAEKIGVGDTMSIEDFDKFCNLHRDYAVRVMDTELNFLYKSIKQLDYSQVKTIYILLFKSHYFYVNNINALFNPLNNNNTFCTGCDSNISKITFAKHKCMRPKCRYCTQMFDSDFDLHSHYNFGLRSAEYFRCETCNSKFYNQNCYNYHKSCCKGGYYCEICRLRSSRSAAEHVCGEKYCITCKFWYVEETIGVNDIIPHRCYMTKLKVKSIPLDCYAYDVESTLDVIGDGDEKTAMKTKHELSLICMVHLGTWVATKYTVSEFLEFIARQKKKITLFAHNAKSYDNYLLLGEILKNAVLPIGKIIEKGRKVLYMQIGNVTFVDSMNHFGGSLQSQIDTFGLKNRLLEAGFDMRKGFFPYTFYTSANRKYIGSIPGREYFEIGEKDRDDFENWYAEMQTKPYDIDAECIKYCIQDCAILAMALDVYRMNGIKINNINPLASVTIAGYTMKVFRTNHLVENTIVKPSLAEYNFSKRAMQGGRTCTFVLHKKVPVEELPKRRIDYADVISMYPWVLSECDMPIGAANIVTYNEDTIENNNKIISDTFGFIECDITCPRDLLIPVLLRMDEIKGKLVDSLENMTKVVYTSVELNLAIKKGYIVTRIYEIHHYKKSNVMFRDYIKKYIKIKQSADKTIKECKKNGDLVGADAALGLRAIAKSMLNNLWGKFGQNDNITFTEYYQNPVDWFRLVALERKELVEIQHATVLDGILYCKYKDIKKTTVKLSNTNMAIAAFTTAHARVRLYNAMDKIGINSGRVMYCDTDSVIYEWVKDGQNLEYGNELGDFKLETEYPIVEFASLGPKTYAYITSNEHQIVKSKGFGVDRFVLKDSDNEQLKEKVINLNTYVHLLNGGLGSKLAYSYSGFIRKNRSITTEMMEKILKFEYNKRIIVDMSKTIPFGYDSGK